MADERDEEPVPRIPRGRGMKLSTPQLIRIAVVAVTLVALIVLIKPCSRAVSNFVTSFSPPDAAVRLPDAAAPPAEGVILRGDMTPEERQRLIEAELNRARGATAVDAGVVVDAAVGK